MRTVRDPNENKTEKRAPDALKLALHEHLKNIVAGELTTRMLLELEQAAAHIQRLLVISGEPRAFRKARHQLGLGYGDPMEIIGPNDPEGPPPDPAFAGLGPALAPAAFGGAENFGVEALRDLIAGAKEPKLVDLLQSLESAEALLKDKPENPTYKKAVEKLQKRVSDAMGLHDSTDALVVTEQGDPA